MRIERRPRGRGRDVLVLLGLSAALALPARPDVLTWTPTSLSGVGVAALEVDPRDPSRLWAATDEGGVYLSVDGGLKFERLPAAVPGGRLRTLELDPADPARVYVSSTKGLFHLRKDGSWEHIWSRVGEGGVIVFAVDPSAPGTILVSDGSDHIERSTDAGATWGDVLFSPTVYRVSQLVFDPSGSGVALGTEWTTRPPGVLLRSVDHGLNWTRLGAYSIALTFDPFGSGTVYGVQHYSFDPGSVPTHVKSLDGGQTWTPFAPSSEDASGALAVLRSGAVLAAGPGGILRTDGAGSPWVPWTVGPPGGGSRRLVSLDRDGTDLRLATGSGLYRTVRTPAPDPLPRTTFLPAIVDAFGEQGARFRTSVALFNASVGMAEGTLTYVPAASAGATGGGSVPLRLRGGEQRSLSDVFAELRGAGLAIPKATAGQPQVGTLRATTTDGGWGGQVVALATVSTPSGPGFSGTGLWFSRRAASRPGRRTSRGCGKPRWRGRTWRSRTRAPPGPSGCVSRSSPTGQASRGRRSSHRESGSSGTLRSPPRG